MKLKSMQAFYSQTPHSSRNPEFRIRRMWIGVNRSNRCGPIGVIGILSMCRRNKSSPHHLQNQRSPRTNFESYYRGRSCLTSAPWPSTLTKGPTPSWPWLTDWLTDFVFWKVVCFASSSDASIALVSCNLQSEVPVGEEAEVDKGEDVRPRHCPPQAPLHRHLRQFTIFRPWIPDSWRLGGQRAKHLHVDRHQF